MTLTQYEKVKSMTNKVIGLLKWKGADYESKERKVVRELAQIRKYCYQCVTDKTERTQGGDTN